MKISLIIPVHNLEKYIEPLLISLKYQQYDHDLVEPIFVCDSCEDNTHQIIEDILEDSFNNLIIIDRQYKSSGLSRNDGIAMATGDIIWLLDGDDWLIDNYALKKIESAFTQNPNIKILHINWLSNLFTLKNYSHTVWQWVMVAEYAKQTQFSSRQYDDDVEWVNKLMQKYGNDFKNCPSLDELYFYNFMREGSVMFKRLNQK